MALPLKLKRVLQQIEKHLPYPFLYDFVMTEKEKKLFDQHVRDAKQYLEFGMGGSTIRVMQKSKALVHSIDSSAKWIQLMEQYRIIRKNLKKRLTLHHVDIGPTGEWGFPLGNDFHHQFTDYSSAIFSKINPSTLDTVLVDGRFRVACTLKTILECHQNKGLVIMIHDFWKRPSYHPVLKYLDETNRADTLGIFKIKEKIDLNAVKNDFEKYQFQPA